MINIAKQIAGYAKMKRTSLILRVKNEVTTKAIIVPIE